MNSKRFLLFFLPLVFLFLAAFAVWQNKKLLYQFGCCKQINYSGQLDLASRRGVFDGKEVSVPDEVFKEDKYYAQVLGATSGEKRIEVSINEQKLRAWEGDKLFLETPVSTGLRFWPTPKGEFRIWIKLRATKMEGGVGKYYYNLPNVPYVMFFENDEIPGWRGYGIHGAYWHNDFGTPRSHGCVNLPVDVARQLYYWADPVLPEGKTSVITTTENQGTKIIIY
ncbi:MAG: hypothetical protein KatS3mg088_395 [Patescibacteria group bacterium]|nr:MAG: hypothetical protein KatS3mg088_395 [Patescibacteria group bacterium]